jgi:uncharacterized protein (TIGR02147 family)
MESQTAIQRVLRVKLIELQKNNPRFSLRAYATRLELSAGALSALMNGKRIISKKMAMRIADKLMLDPQERSGIVAAFERKKFNQAELDYQRINSEQFRMLSDWEHHAILSLINTSDFDSDSEWIAARLGISKTQAELAIERLIYLGFLRRSKGGALTRQTIAFRTSDDIADISIKKAHDKTLDLARESLHRDDVKLRDFSSITFAIDPENIEEAKAIIRKCQDDLSVLLESGNQSEVYRFSSQLFPLSKIRKNTQETLDV